MASSKLDFPRFLPAPSCRSKVVIRSASVSKGGLRTLLLNSGDLPSGLAHFLNSGLQGSPKFTRADFGVLMNFSDQITKINQSPRAMTTKSFLGAPSSTRAAFTRTHALHLVLVTEPSFCLPLRSRQRGATRLYLDKLGYFASERAALGDLEVMAGSGAYHAVALPFELRSHLAFGALALRGVPSDVTLPAPISRVAHATTCTLSV